MSCKYVLGVERCELVSWMRQPTGKRQAHVRPKCFDMCALLLLGAAALALLVLAMETNLLLRQTTLLFNKNR